VPGDFATVGEAFNAVQHVGGVICIGPHVETLPQTSIWFLTPTKDLTIIGSGPDATRLVGELDVNDAGDNQRATPIRSVGPFLPIHARARPILP